MAKTTVSAILLCLSVSMSTQVWSAGDCKKSDSVNTICELHVSDVRPTQFAVGSLAVDCKAADISSKSKKKLKKYLADEQRRVPVVIGPDGEFYMTDHHHLATALQRAESSDWKDKDKILSIEIIATYHDKDISMDAFWGEMQSQHRSYNYDNKGMPNMNFALLPQDVDGLLNDPYRTLSRWVRESCGYVKAGKEQCDNIRPDPKHAAPFFMEFYWGDFFRAKLPLKIAGLAVCQSIPYSSLCLADEVAQLQAIYEDAMKLAASEEAKAYFEQLKLDPYEYGYNPSGERLELKFGGPREACEEEQE